MSATATTMSGLMEMLENVSFNPLDHAGMLNQSMDDSADEQATYPCRLPHHELSYEFPVLNLIPEGAQLYLPPPEHMEFRQKPDLTKFFLSELEVNFRYNMPPNMRDADIRGVVLDQTAGSLYTTIESLSTRIGKTTLLVAPFYYGYSGLQYRVVLQTKIPGETQTARIWDLTAIQWESMLSIKRPWIQLLADIVYRKSASSFLKAGESLQYQDADVFKRDFDSWNDRWCTQAPRNALELIKRLLKTEKGEAIDLLRFQFGDVIVRLPCGCVGSISRQNLETLTPEVCETLLCPRCGALVLDEKDLGEAAMVGRLAALSRQTGEQAAWMPLDRRVTNEKDQRIQLDVLGQSLAIAWRSLDIPELMMPQVLHPANSEEASTALVAMETWIASKADQFIQITPKSLYEKLKVVADSAITITQESTGKKYYLAPDGWSTFLHLWLSRTINFCIDRHCMSRGFGHDGIHVHDDGMTFWHDAAMSDGSASLELHDVRILMDEYEAEMDDEDLEVGIRRGLLDKTL